MQDAIKDLNTHVNLRGVRASTRNEHSICRPSVHPGQINDSSVGGLTHTCAVSDRRICLASVPRRETKQTLFYEAFGFDGSAYVVD